MLRFIVSSIMAAVLCVNLAIAGSSEQKAVGKESISIIQESKNTMSYKHDKFPVIQVAASGGRSIVFVNDFDVLNRGASHYVFQTGLDDYLVKGENRIDVYINPRKLDERDESVYHLGIRVFPESALAHGYTGYESLEEYDDKKYMEYLPESPSKGADIVVANYSYNHKDDKFSVTSSASEKAFNILADSGNFSREVSDNGDYVFNTLSYETLENGIHHIVLQFDLREERPFSPILKADKIAVSKEPPKPGQTKQELDPALKESLYAETRKAYELLKNKDWAGWHEYISPVLERYSESPLFKNIVPPGFTTKDDIEIAEEDMAASLLDFPSLDDEEVFPAVAYQGYLAVAHNAIFYKSSKFRYNLSVDLYYALDNGKWVLAYIKAG